MEYGLQDFTLGNGTTQQTSGTDVFIQNLDPSTTYDAYVRAQCGSTFGEFSERVRFTTGPICNTPGNIILIQANSTNIQIAFNTNGESAFEIEYGLIGFELGTGTIVNTSSNNLFITGLTPDTVYELYLRANCGSDGFSEYADTLVFATDP
ncbi:MAG: fibronectin type III domain-containing protein [Bacteroidota bacterium]